MADSPGPRARREEPLLLSASSILLGADLGGLMCGGGRWGVGAAPPALGLSEKASWRRLLPKRLRQESTALCLGSLPCSSHTHPQTLLQRPLSTPFPTVETFLSSCQKRKLPPGMRCIPQLPWQWPAAVLGSGLALHQRLGIATARLACCHPAPSRLLRALWLPGNSTW